MKRISIIIVFLLAAFTINAQDTKTKNHADFKLGDGLNFSFEDQAYNFTITGFLQPHISYMEDMDGNAAKMFNARSAALIFTGNARDEKVSFMLQLDYSRPQPLLDAWISYQPHRTTSITVGQKLTFVNNREMLYNEHLLQFTRRSTLSDDFSNTGREFGIFIESYFGNSFIVSPKLALTSGDGRNSFDLDQGGAKIGGRLDVYPLGDFTKGNELTVADLMHEESPKLLIGGAYSKNYGASHRVGEGKDDFLMYDADQNTELPDYNKINADLLFKYKGFSFLAEFVNTTADSFTNLYTKNDGISKIKPQEISSFLSLGNGYNFQTGYVTKKGYSFDLRYSMVDSEFSNYANAILNDVNSYTIGFSKYFKPNGLKLQTSFTKSEYDMDQSDYRIELLMQIVF